MDTQYFIGPFRLRPEVQKIKFPPWFPFLKNYINKKYIRYENRIKQINTTTHLVSFVYVYHVCLCFFTLVFIRMPIKKWNKTALLKTSLWVHYLFGEIIFSWIPLNLSIITQNLPAQFSLEVVLLFCCQLWDKFKQKGQSVQSVPYVRF